MCSVKHYASQVRSCRDLAQARLLHGCILASEHRHNRYLNNLLIELYANCGSLDEAVNVFRNISRPNVFSWTLMISAYAQASHIHEARAAFESMPEKDIVAWNTMLGVYSLRAGFISGAENIFYGMPERDVVSWTAMISAYAQNGYIEKATETFCRMPCRNLFSWNTMVSAYGDHDQVEKARNLFDSLPGKDTVSWNAMLTAYAQSGHINEAKKLFDEMPRPVVTVSWNILIGAYARSRMVASSFRALAFMDLDGTQPDRLTFAGVLQECDDSRLGKLAHGEMETRGLDSDVLLTSVLINMYGRCGACDDARRVFDRAVHRNVVSWTAMMRAYSHTGQASLAVGLFSCMNLEGLKPDKVAVITVLEALAKLGHLSKCKPVHALVVDGFVQDCWLGNGLVNMYSECGSMVEARSVFDSLVHRDVVTWNVLLAGYAKHGDGIEALHLYRTMELLGAVPPDSVTLCVLLLACSHTGLVEDGRYYLTSMEDNHGVVPTREHLLCMVDLLGRAGHVEKAEELMNVIKDGDKVALDSSGWLALLSACRTQNEMKCGARAVAAMEWKDSAGLLLLRNLVAQQLQNTRKT